MNIRAYWEDRLAKRSHQGAERSMKGRDLPEVDFFSNDYLGLARNHYEDSEIQSEDPRWIGSTGSRLLSGDSSQALELEKDLAHYHHQEASLLYASGFMANVGLFTCMARRGDTLIYDQYIHASIRKAIQWSGIRSYSFLHNDMADLEKKVKAGTGQRFVVSEAVFSMDGDQGDLEGIAELCKRHEALFIVDEAHSTGVFGQGGRGLVDELGLSNEVWCRILTYGKAGGCHGALILGEELLIRYLQNFSYPFIYTTAPSLHSLSLIRRAYRYFEKGERQKVLHENIAYFRSLIEKELAAFFMDSSSPIQSLVMPGNEKVQELADQLQQSGFFIKAIRSPTVPLGTERLRICLHAHNTKEEIKTFVGLLKQLIL